MEYNTVEVAVVKKAEAQATLVQQDEFADLQLALIGAGTADAFLA